ncbi:GFA family protein [Paraneptunicella aestuarii]
MIRTAKCCCGKTSIRVSGEPKVHAVCHCLNCKKRTGSAFGISAYFRDEQIQQQEGETSIYQVDKPSSQYRHFCPHCGTTLFWKVELFPGLTGVAGGCFAEQPLPEPVYTASNEHKLDWCRLPEYWKTSIQLEDFTD